jgi:DNA helicase HerA-like ATPase
LASGKCGAEQRTFYSRLFKRDELAMHGDRCGYFNLFRSKNGGYNCRAKSTMASQGAKKPVLLVIDEAHNICPQQSTSRLQEIATQYIVEIAGEGLKYGLRLLLVSQRPAKIHASVLTQCDNLVLMRMTSTADVETLAQAFSQVSPSLVAQSKFFVKGESLIVGEIAKSPTFAKFEGRLTQEGGGA